MKIFFFIIFLFLYVQLNANNFFKSYSSQSFFSLNDSIKKRNNGIKLLIAPIQIGASLEIEPLKKYYFEIGSTILPPKDLFNFYIQNKYKLFSDSLCSFKIGTEITYIYGSILGKQEGIALSPCFDFNYKRFGVCLLVYHIYFYYNNTLSNNYFLGPVKKNDFPLYIRLSYKFNF